MIAHLAFAAACTLGVEVTNISHRIRHDRAIPDYVSGAIVRMVRIKSPAARAGIQVGDVIQGVGDQLVQNVCGYQSAIASHGCEDVRFTIRRGTATIAIEARLVAAARQATPHFDDQQACRNGDPAACTALGKTHKAIDLFRLACDLGDSEGCYLLAVNLRKDDPDAPAAYRQACDDGNALACTNLGWMLQFGHSLKIDLGEAVRLYRRGCQGSACSGPNNVGCVNLGRMLRDGVGAKADSFESTRIFRQVCDRSPLNDEDAGEIARACSLAGTASLTGKGAAKDIQQALALLEKGCAAGDNFGCYNLATLYDNGNEVKRDKTRAMMYYKKACAAGDEEACRRLEKLNSSESGRLGRSRRASRSATGGGCRATGAGGRARRAPAAGGTPALRHTACEISAMTLLASDNRSNPRVSTTSTYADPSGR